MATVNKAIWENDVVALHEPVGRWPAATVGAAVSLYDGASLVEVTDERGRTRDLFTVANELLEIQPRYMDHARGSVEA
jgi:hypothetical protein